MDIIFDLRRVGLGNNGGSLTLIKSGNTLQEMGHNVYFADTGKNQNTWEPLKAKHMIVKNKNALPKADVIIATGYKSVPLTVGAPASAGVKAHWIRGWETWQMKEKAIFSNVLMAPTVKLVNSIGLQKKLKFYNIKSKIIRPGYDLDLLMPTDTKKRDIVILGGLYTRGKHEKIKRTKWIFDAHRHLKNKYGNVALWMFGTDQIQRGLVDNYFHRPDMKKKELFYNNIDIWLSPAMQEGLHMPPAEAMMTRCPVVGTDAKLSGTHDYLIDGVTGIVAKNDHRLFLKAIEELYLDKKGRRGMGNRARKKIEKLGDRKQNMQELIDYISGIINDG